MSEVIKEGEILKYIMHFTLTEGFTYIYCTCLNCFLLFRETFFDGDHVNFYAGDFF